MRIREFTEGPTEILRRKYLRIATVSVQSSRVDEASGRVRASNKKAFRKERLQISHFSKPYTPAACRFPADLARSCNAGTDSGAVTLRSGIGAPFKASTSISIARSVFGRIKIVAASVPLRTQAWPVFGIPSQPVIGIFIQRARALSSISLNAFFAPMAVLSSCAP